MPLVQGVCGSRSRTPFGRFWGGMIVNLTFRPCHYPHFQPTVLDFSVIRTLTRTQPEAVLVLEVRRDVCGSPAF